MLPTFSVQGQYGYGQGALVIADRSLNVRTARRIPPTTAVTVTGQLNVPIYQAGVEEATVRQAKELHAQAQLNIQCPTVRCATRSRSPGHSSKRPKRRSRPTKPRNAPTKSPSRACPRSSRSAAARSSMCLNAQQELLNAAVALVTAKRNAEVAAFQVLSASGALTAKNLGLKVQTLRPARALRRRCGALDRPRRLRSSVARQFTFLN